MEWLGDSFVVTGAGERMLLRAVTETSASARAGVPRLAQRAQLPIVGRRRDGSYVTSRFQWDWAPAVVRRARVMVALDEALVPGGARVFAPSSTAVHVRALGWRITWPQFHLDSESPDAPRM